MRIALLGLFMTSGCLAAQVQPADIPVQSASRAAEPQPDSHGVYKPGGAVTFPKLIHQTAPHYTKPAKKEKITGHVVVSLVVGETGKPQDVHVIRGLGYGLDEEAVKTVSAYVFEPSQLHNKPVPILMHVDINFQIFEQSP